MLCQHVVYLAIHFTCVNYFISCPHQRFSNMSPNVANFSGEVLSRIVSVYKTNVVSFSKHIHIVDQISQQLLAMLVFRPCPLK